MSEQVENVAPRCNCSLGWRFHKGTGPDPARCQVHGEPNPTTATESEAR